MVLFFQKSITVFYIWLSRVICHDYHVFINFLCSISSSEGKTIVEDKLSEVSASLLAAYDSGGLIAALEEGQSGWQKWVKSFGKALKRKVGF